MKLPVKLDEGLFIEKLSIKARDILSIDSMHLYIYWRKKIERGPLVIGFGLFLSREIIRNDTVFRVLSKL